MANINDLDVNLFRYLYAQGIKQMNNAINEKNYAVQEEAKKLYKNDEDAVANYIKEHSVQRTGNLVKAYVLNKLSEKGFKPTEKAWEKLMRKAGFVTKNQADMSLQGYVKSGKKDKNGKDKLVKVSPDPTGTDAELSWLGRWNNPDPNDKIQNGDEWLGKSGLVRRLGTNPKIYWLERSLVDPDKPRTFIYDTQKKNSEEWNKMTPKEREEALKSDPWNYLTSNRRIGVLRGLLTDPEEQRLALMALEMANPDERTKLFPHQTPEQKDARYRFAGMVGKKIQDIIEKHPEWDADKVKWFIEDMGGVIRKSTGAVERFKSLVEDSDKEPFPERTPMEINYTDNQGRDHTVSTTKEAMEKQNDMTPEVAAKKQERSDKRTKVKAKRTIMGKGGYMSTENLDENGDVISKRVKGEGYGKKKDEEKKPESVTTETTIKPDSEKDTIESKIGKDKAEQIIEKPKEDEFTKKLDRQLYNSYGNAAGVKTPEAPKTAKAANLSRIAKTIAGLEPGQREALAKAMNMTMEQFNEMMGE